MNIVEDVTDGVAEAWEDATAYVRFDAADGRLYVEGLDVASVQVLGVDGQLVVNEQNAAAGVDISTLPQGLYVVKLQTNAKALMVKVLKP